MSEIKAVECFETFLRLYYENVQIDLNKTTIDWLYRAKDKTSGKVVFGECKPCNEKKRKDLRELATEVKIEVKKPSI